MKTVLSLFDGMSGGQIALIENGVKFDKYYASEIDKYAINQTQFNFPDTIQLGDIEKWREWDINWSSVDLILAGSPCQGFSFNGKRLNFKDPRSRLFFTFVDILEFTKIHNPNVKFLLENVKMAVEYLSVISTTLKVYPVEINSARVSAQNRKRLYWTNIKTRYDDNLRIDVVDIPQPKDLGIKLWDILEPHVHNTWVLSDKQLKCITNPKRFGKYVSFNGDKSRTLQVRDVASWNGTFIKTGDVVRFLTPEERARLQTIPNWYKWIVSEREQVKMIANGWTIKVIQHILSYL